MTLQLKVISFSYKKGIPEDPSGHGGGFIFDCRALPNPGREEIYKKSTGLDPDVIEHLGSSLEVSNFLIAVQSVLMVSVDNYISRQFTNLLVGFGCTGGQHRSIYCADKTARWLTQTYSGKIAVNTTHRDMPKF